MNESQRKLFNLKAAVLLTILICLIYSNTLNSGWYLDDHHNIPRNSGVHMHSLGMDSVIRSLYAAPRDESLNRPIAYLTFALNWHWGQNDPKGYRVVNIAIHAFIAFFLFLTIVTLFETPNINGWDKKSIYFIALLASVLWAVHPIQIQAVTYIVQRMASMAALFYIIGIFCYLKARISKSAGYRVFFFGLCCLVFLLGIGTKNNAILLPISLVLIEFLFFRDLSQRSTQKKAAAIFLGGIIIVGGVGLLLFLDGSLARIFGRYETRAFTMDERLLTQSRIVLFHISQIFYPIAERFSIEHDFAYSTSLFRPWTTLPSIATIFSLVGLALWRIRKNPFLAFAILFFFGNHIIESSIIPLEMVFEHRNYLPSLFLFLPIAAGIKLAFDHYYFIKKPMFYFLVFSVCAVIIGIGTSTYIRNWDWRSAKSLWEDAMKKAPQSARPLQNLAWGYYLPTGQNNEAIDLYKRALYKRDNNVGFEIYSYSNLSNIYYSRLNDYEKSLKYALKTIDISPTHDSGNRLTVKSFCKLNRYDEALLHLDDLITDNPEKSEYHYLKGFILLKTSKPEKALNCFQKSLQLSPDNFQYLREIGFSFSLMEYYERGYWFFRRARTFNPQNVGLLIGLSDNRIRAEQADEAHKWAERLINAIGVDNIEDDLKKIAEDPLGIPFSSKPLASLVAEQLKERAEQYSERAVQLEKNFTLAK